MRKYLFLVLCILLMIPGSSSATLWTYPNDLEGGFWLEKFGTGAPGSPGSELFADWNGQWKLSGAVIPVG